MAFLFGAQPHRPPSGTAHHGVKLPCVLVRIAADPNAGRYLRCVLAPPWRVWRILSASYPTLSGR